MDAVNVGKVHYLQPMAKKHLNSVDDGQNKYWLN